MKAGIHALSMDSAGPENLSKTSSPEAFINLVTKERQENQRSTRSVKAKLP